MGKNIKAIHEWFTKNRPDIPAASVNGIMENPGLALIATASFEAGREYQRKNPKEPKGPEGYL